MDEAQLIAKDTVDLWALNRIQIRFGVKALLDLKVVQTALRSMVFLSSLQTCLTLSRAQF